MNFHRYYEAGQIVFITQVVKDRQTEFCDPFSQALFTTTLYRVKSIHPFNLLAYILLPDHFHILIQPKNLSNFSQIMHSFKSNFTKLYKDHFKITNTFSFWQKRFWDHVIRNEKDLENHIHYIHFNPIKHGYVNKPEKWENSSYSIWKSHGAYDKVISWEEPENYSWGE